MCSFLAQVVVDSNEFARGQMAILGTGRLIAWGVLGFCAGLYAAYKGYPRFLSILVCIPLGPLGFIGVFLLPPVGEGCDRVAEDRRVDRELAESKEGVCCPKCGRENSVSTKVCPRCEQRLK